MRYVLVLQWSSRTAESDIDKIYELEDRLDDVLAPDSSVDGHDLGAGEMNIFIDTERPVEAFAAVAAVVRSDSAWLDFRAAYREVDNEQYTILWPKNLTELGIA